MNRLFQVELLKMNMMEFFFWDDIDYLSFSIKFNE